MSSHCNWFGCLSISAVITIVVLAIGILVTYQLVSGQVKDITSVSRKCPEEKYVTVPSTKIPAYTTPSQALASYLMPVCENVTVSNCEGSDGIGAVPLPPGYDQKATLSSDGVMYGYVFTDSKGSSPALIAFTGTFSYDEWKSDLDYKQVAPSFSVDGAPAGILVHEGFLDIYQAIRDQLHSAIPKSGDVVVTGHSLGGALATICAYDLYAIKPYVYTFAAPRSGNQAYATFLSTTYNQSGSSPLVRYFNTEDVVPDLPPPVLGTVVYAHAGANSAFTLNLGSTVKNHVDAYLQYYQ